MLTAPGGRFEVGLEQVHGTEMKVYRHRPHTLRELFDTATAAGAELEHLVYGSRRLNFRSLRSQVDGVAATLRDRHSLAPGDRVAVLSANNPEWVITFWATTNLGGVVVGLNAWWKADEINFGLRDSGARILVADRERFERIQHDVVGLSDLEAVYVIDAEVAQLDERTHPFEDLVVEHEALDATPILEDDYALILYTSGTTGTPKGAISTHRSMIANVQNTAFNNLVASLLAEQSHPSPGISEQRPQTTLLLTSPMFHVSGCHSGFVVGLASMSTLVVPVGRFEAEKALSLIENERVTTWATVPTMVWRVVEDPNRHAYDTSSVTAIAYGGSPSGVELRRRIQETFPSVGLSLRNAYGLTETSSVATTNAGQDLIDRPDSVGRPTPIIDVRVVDSAGNDVPTGGIGEVWIRGPIVMPGYWRNTGATAEVLTPDQWLRTGDLGRLDEAGFLYVTDRMKDMIIRGGENVYCVEVENRLIEHPSIADAAVVGFPHSTLGEIVKAVVQLEPQHSLQAWQVRDWVAQKLANFKVPEIVEITVDRLPRNAAGKLLKSVLRGDVDVPLVETM
jgi:long-chain acyl-CoA synthetase